MPGMPEGTVPILSDTWGLSVATTCVTGLVGAAGAFIKSVESDQYTRTSVLWMILCGVVAVLPLAIALGPTAITSQCRDLLEHLNNKRLRCMVYGMQDDDDGLAATLEAIYQLEQLLGNMNKGQGPGFVIGGKVVTKSMVVKAISVVISFVSVAGPLILNVQSPLPRIVFSAQNKIAARIVDILVAVRKSRRNGIAPAHGTACISNTEPAIIWAAMLF